MILWDKNEKHLTHLICDDYGCIKQERMNSKNEKHFSKWLTMQVCELLQVLTETAIKGVLNNERSWNSKTQ